MGTTLSPRSRKLLVWLTVFGFLFIYYPHIMLQYSMDFNYLFYAYFSILNFIAFMISWCFLSLLFIDPGRPKEVSKQSQSPFSRKQFCQICKTPKPDRCHHCSVCDRCVLQLDHHCPWINSCVGYHTRKQFILLILYTELFHLFTAITLTKYVIQQIQKEQDLTNISLVLSILSNNVMLFIMGQFLKYHIELLIINKTTLEDYLQKQYQTLNNQYDIGTMNNIKQIFGSRYSLWLFPIRTFEGCEEGYYFPTKSMSNNESIKVLNNPPPQFTQIVYEAQQQETPIISDLHKRMMKSQQMALSQWKSEQ